MRTRIKICGITRREDALAAIRLGADALGLVFYAPSPRAVTIEQAKTVVEGLPPFVTLTGLFVDASPEDVRATLAELPLGLLQFHGNESADYCDQFGVPWIKAIRMANGIDLHAERTAYRAASALLLDTFKAGVPGGTGDTFDWAVIPKDMRSEIILAGGLDADNVSEAVRRVRPFAVDVSGGVEQSKGIKDAAKVAAFIEGVMRGDNS